MPIETPKRYSALWVSLHWAVALLLMAVFALGFSTRFVPSALRLAVVGWHMPLGAAILVLMAVRIVVRWRTPHPEPATAGNPFLDKIGVLTHYLLYVFAILMPLAGLGLATTYNLIPFDLGALGNSLAGLAPLHRPTAILLGLLIALHIAAALYHQVIRKDNLLARMWYGK
jgi:cytochrome b561